jgi:RecA/RadA recombinase
MLLANPPSALDLVAASSARVPTGDARLDALFGGGGLPAAGLTEVCGEAGAGKTQLCMMLALRCALPAELGGLGGDCYYLCAEDALPAARLESMARAQPSALSPQQSTPASATALATALATAGTTTMRAREAAAVPPSRPTERRRPR